MSYVVGQRNKKTLMADDLCKCGATAIISRSENGIRIHECLDHLNGRDTERKNPDWLAAFLEVAAA